MHLFKQGQIVRETYEVERFLGEGAFGEVYRVRHHFLGRQAMKVFKLVARTTKETEKLLEEAVILSRIGHPNIIRVFDANVTETPHGLCGFFTMEYVAGGSLEQFWQSYGDHFVPLDKTVEIILQVCRGLAVAHRETPPIVHRDIKPQNILIGYDAQGVRVRLSDFGLAKSVNPMTLMASAKGTISFKAPEVFLEPGADSCAGDVWALGITLYLMLTDRIPYPQLTMLGPAQVPDPSIFRQRILPPSRLNFAVDPVLEQIVLRALMPDPSARYATAEGMLRDLEAWKPRQLDAILPPKMGEADKSTLGMFTSPNQERAQRKITEALSLGRHYDRLVEAADLMEEAMNEWPGLREQYGDRLTLWRRGIIS